MGTCQRLPATRLPAGSLTSPTRPLRGGVAHVAGPRTRWVRIYHHDRRDPDATTLRPRLSVGGRFDPHVDGTDRGVLYVGDDLATAICEALTTGSGSSGRVNVCPNRRVAILEPMREPVTVQDLVARDPTQLGAPHDLGDGHYSRTDTQAWACAIHEDRPADPATGGIYYWSARHRADNGGRVAANTAIWDTAPPLRVRTPGRGIDGRAEYRVTAGRMWGTVRNRLIGAGLTPVAVAADHCGDCREHGFP